MAKGKIILIEDDELISNLYKDALQKAGYIIVTAFDGDEGLKAVKENTDAVLILLDIVLPNMHGIEMLKQIKQNETTKNMQVVLLSGVSDDEIVKEALSIGARDYLRKTITSPDTLVFQVSEYLKTE